LETALLVHLIRVKQRLLKRSYLILKLFNLTIKFILVLRARSEQFCQFQSLGLVPLLQVSHLQNELARELPLDGAFLYFGVQRVFEVLDLFRDEGFDGPLFVFGGEEAGLLR